MIVKCRHSVDMKTCYESGRLMDGLAVDRHSTCGIRGVNNRNKCFNYIHGKPHEHNPQSCGECCVPYPANSAFRDEWDTGSFLNRFKDVIDKAILRYGEKAIETGKVIRGSVDGNRVELERNRTLNSVSYKAQIGSLGTADALVNVIVVEGKKLYSFKYYQFLNFSEEPHEWNTLDTHWVRMNEEPFVFERA